MTTAALAKLLIEGPRVVLVDDISAPMDLVTKTATGVQAVNRDSAEDSEDKEDNGSFEVNKKIAVYLTRLALRLFSVPSFQTFWKDSVLIADPKAEDGRCKIQLVFHRLPDEAHPILSKLLAAPRNPKFTRFIDKGQARTGVEIEVMPDDFGGEEYDYAF